MQVTCREMEEREALRLILEAHQRRHEEDGRAATDRQRLNQLIAHWRAQFAELIEHVRCVWPQCYYWRRVGID